MSEAAGYSVIDQVRDGRPINVRALRRDDRAAMLTAVEHTSTQSMRRRFFATKRSFSDAEVDFFMNIDFDQHVALVAKFDEDGHSVIAGGGRYVVVAPGQAEVAFIVVDAYQGQGVGTVLMRHLARLARNAGLRELVAEVLPENTAMLKLFEKFGFQPGLRREPQVLHLSLRLDQPSAWDEP